MISIAETQDRMTVPGNINKTPITSMDQTMKHSTYQQSFRSTIGTGAPNIIETNDSHAKLGSDISVYNKDELKNSLYESRVTYKFS